MDAIFQVTGKDAFGCKAQLKADGFVFYGPLKCWMGTQAAIDKFQKRGFRVKVFFTQVNYDNNPDLYETVTGKEFPRASY